MSYAEVILCSLLQVVLLLSSEDSILVVPSHVFCAKTSMQINFQVILCVI